jgi:two-component system, OmpR family, response regulator MprA
MATVLVVEDDPHVVTLLRELLRHEGYDVEVATDGLVGLLKLRTAVVDAVLLDVMMPDVDGTRLLRQLLEEHGGQLPLPVLVVTGSPDGARTCRELLGDDRVLEKPFDPAELLERVRTLLADRRAS